MARRLSWVLILVAGIAFAPQTARAQAQSILYDCNNAGPISDQGGWQVPGADPISGDATCDADGSFLMFTTPQAYYASMLLAPNFGDLTVETQVLYVEREGADTDGFSLLLRWNGPSHPSCCEPLHAASGLRLLFSVARNRLEVTQEIDGASGPLLGSLPVTLQPETSRALKVNLRGGTLDLIVDGTPVGSLSVPETPAALFGLDMRGLLAVVGPIALTLRCPNDFDCDGVADAGDNCPADPPADQTDLDGDGLGNPCDPDDDGDGVPDASDVCPLAIDPGQEDADHDQIGDACDTCPLDAANDFDHDGLCAPADNCPFEANPDQADLDADGEGDFCDLNDGYLLIRWADKSRMTWQPESPFLSYNLYRRNVEQLRSTGVYVLDPRTFPGGLNGRSCNWVGDYTVNEAVPAGQAIAYFVSGNLNGMDTGFGEDSSGTPRPNPYPCGCTPMVRVAHAIDARPLPANRIIDNLTDWCTYFPAYCSLGLVDFATEVAVLHSFDAPDTCYDTEITCIERFGSEVRVTGRNVEYQCPGCFFILTTPYDVVKIPRPATTGTFSFGLAHLPCP